jgi:hypothetical protein
MQKQLTEMDVSIIQNLSNTINLLEIKISQCKSYLKTLQADLKQTKKTKEVFEKTGILQY